MKNKNQKNIISFDNVTIKYPKSKENVLENISLDLQKGKMIAFIGPSGVGKTTLFKIIVRAIKPINGNVFLNNENIYNLSKNQWKTKVKKIGFLTQKPNLIESDSVYLNIKRSINDYQNWFFKLISFLTFDKRVKIFETLDKLGILNKAFSRVSDLSGGQKQKVEIAKLLIKDVDLILGDEPTSNLDYKSANSVMEILKEINKKLNITIIINIHDLNLATSYFDQIIMIKDKQIFLNESINLKNKWNLNEKVKRQIV